MHLAKTVHSHRVHTHRARAGWDGDGRDGGCEKELAARVVVRAALVRAVKGGLGGDMRAATSTGRVVPRPLHLRLHRHPIAATIATIATAASLPPSSPPPSRPSPPSPPPAPPPSPQSPPLPPMCFHLVAARVVVKAERR